MHTSIFNRMSAQAVNGNEHAKSHRFAACVPRGPPAHVAFTFRYRTLYLDHIAQNISKSATRQFKIRETFTSFVAFHYSPEGMLRALNRAAQYRFVLW